MHKSSVRAAVLVAASLFFAIPHAYGGECLPTGLASYSNLGRAMAKMRDGASGELLAIWLLQSPDSAECKFVFRVDRLLAGGAIMSMTFDAKTLDEVPNNDARGWAEYGGTGQGGEASNSGRGSGSGGESSNSGSGSNSGDDDDGDDNSGSGSSGSGSSGSGSDGSSGSGGDDGGSSGSGSGGDDGGSSGSGSGGSGSGGSGSGGGDD